MFDKKEKSTSKKEGFDGPDTDEELIAKQKKESLEIVSKIKKVMCQCRKQIIDPTKKGEPCSYCGGLVVG